MASKKESVMKISTRYQAKGMYRVVRGTVKEFAGKITSNTTLGVKGKFDRFAGNVQRRIGKAQGVLGF
jgi:uncharacterized protein YjbJ (UPF0337 family)